MLHGIVPQYTHSIHVLCTVVRRRLSTRRFESVHSARTEIVLNVPREGQQFRNPLVPPFKILLLEHMHLLKYPPDKTPMGPSRYLGSLIGQQRLKQEGWSCSTGKARRCKERETVRALSHDDSIAALLHMKTNRLAL
jgi:hypothetical protein